ncbi:MAG: prepilin peptidase, partial [candidate division KSB1 bacterium]|nr:prepilin peptidase [candidate division KSB1 bacterium]
FNSILGAIVGGGLFMLLYYFDAMGAGDVKLGAAVGCWLGIRFAAFALFYTILLGGLMAIVQLSFKRGRKNSMKTKSIDSKTSDETSIFEGKCEPNAATLPYGIAISGGVFALFIKILWETRP